MVYISAGAFDDPSLKKSVEPSCKCDFLALLIQTYSTTAINVPSEKIETAINWEWECFVVYSFRTFII